ncbi:MAG: nucleotidyltransferase family protein [Proteobacteria bacterium]|nr:nucleotidyltransferase family protein [Pseudomonadota bacterium]NBX85784.1 nucleotidyltransferase family protein [Pseudomonadota bacterium]
MKARIDTAMVLAAGMGSRLRPLTDEMPKPLINIGGEPIIVRTLKALRRAGVVKVVMNTHHFATMLEATVRANTPAGMTVIFSREEELLETGGGIRKALKYLGEKPFFVVNSDAVWWEEKYPLLEPLAAAFDQNKHDALLAVVPINKVKEFQPLGDFKFDKRSKKLKRNEKREKWDVVYGSVHVMHPSFIAAETLEKFGLIRIWEPAMAEGRLHGFLYDFPWVEIGTHTGLHLAREMVRR